MLKKISHFVQYHNFFSLGVTLVFAGASASFAASPELRAEVLAQNEVVRSADNTYVINTNFDAYDMGLKVQSVAEDSNIYYVGYIYNTVEAVDYVWKQVPKIGSMKISKKELEGRDLGLYVADQLGQIMDQQISYLKEFQKEQKKEGETQKVVAIEYSGLVGRFLKTDEKVFEGYQPVIPPSEVASNQSANSNVAAAVVSVFAPSAPPVSLLSREDVQGLIRDTVRQLLLQSQQPPATTTPMLTLTSASAATTTPSTSTPALPDTSPLPASVHSRTLDTVPTPAIEPAPRVQATSTAETVVAPKDPPPAPVSTPDPVIKITETKPVPPVPVVSTEKATVPVENTISAPQPAPVAPVIIPETPVLPPTTTATPVASTPTVSDPVPIPPLVPTPSST